MYIKHLNKKTKRLRLYIFWSKIWLFVELLKTAKFDLSQYHVALRVLE